MACFINSVDTQVSQANKLVTLSTVGFKLLFQQWHYDCCDCEFCDDHTKCDRVVFLLHKQYSTKLELASHSGSDCDRLNRRPRILHSFLWNQRHRSHELVRSNGFDCDMGVVA